MVVRIEDIDDKGLSQGESPVASRSASPSPTKRGQNLERNTHLRRRIFDNAPTWRRADFIVLWELHGGNKKGYLTSIEAKKLLMEFGVPWRQVSHFIKPGNHWDFDACFEKLQLLLPTERMMRDVQKCLEKTDADENHGKISGMINVETFESAMLSHGMNQLELDLFLSRYKRESIIAGTLTWGTIFQDLYGPEEVEKPRLEKVISVFTSKRDVAEIKHNAGKHVDPFHE